MSRCLRPGDQIDRTIMRSHAGEPSLRFLWKNDKKRRPRSLTPHNDMLCIRAQFLTPEWLPLGVIDAWMWDREKVNADGVRPDLKESGRWIEGYGRIAEMAAAMPATRLAYVADREADMIELMKYAQGCCTPADWLVRAKADRALPDGDWIFHPSSTAAGVSTTQLYNGIGQRVQRSGSVGIFVYDEQGHLIVSGI